MVYILLHLLFDDALIYIVGGILATGMKFFNKEVDELALMLIWLIILIFIVFLFFKLHGMYLKYTILALSVILLFLVDFIVYDTFNLDAIASYQRHLIFGLTLLVKSILLSLIIVLDRSRRKSKPKLAHGLP